jgi:hypothetical protein
MLSEAVRLPLAEGVNEVTTVQLPPAGSEDPQVLFSVKSAGSEPLNAMLEMVKVAPPVLFTVMV